jgi:hypothetical protein
MNFLSAVLARRQSPETGDAKRSRTRGVLSKHWILSTKVTFSACLRLLADCLLTAVPWTQRRNHPGRSSVLLSI